MAEEVVRTIENVDRLFSEIVVNGESHVSQRYVAPRSQNASPSSIRSTQGEDVYGVDLNNVLHNFSDPDVVSDVEALQQGLAGEISARTTADQTLDLAIAQEANARSSADNILQGNINIVSGNVSTLQGKVSTIEEEIPSQASSSNQLADKNFVNSSIATNTANFLGTYTSMADIEAIQNPTNNDYVFLQTTDSAGNNVFDRYKYNADQDEWLFEYELNNSSFTSEQWATINSGLTSSSVSDAINALDVAQVGGSGKYISAISEADGKISATETTMDTAPTANSTNAVTSGAVKTAIDNEATARGTAITNAINALDVASVGGSGKYISAISEADGKISATEETMDTEPTESSTKACTSGGIRTFVKTTINNEISALDVNSVGGDGQYILKISEADGKINATAVTMDTAPTANSTKGCTSGGIKTYVDNQISTAITQVLNTSF